MQKLCVNSCSLCQVLICLITLIMDSMKKRGRLIVKSSGGFSWGWTLLLPSALRTRSRWVTAAPGPRRTEIVFVVTGMRV